MIISTNRKTTCSINFPIKGHCKPTDICKKTCYAKRGTLRLPICTKKQHRVSEYFKGNDISQAIAECMIFTTARLNGSGDLLNSHVKNIITLAKKCPQTTFWGMTRKPNIALAINNKLPNLSLLVTVDASSPKSTWDYPGKLCFGPRRPIDDIPNEERIVTVFPYHHNGQVIKNIPEHPKDCPVIRHKVSGCLECQRCWKGV